MTSKIFEMVLQSESEKANKGYKPTAVESANNFDRLEKAQKVSEVRSEKILIDFAKSYLHENFCALLSSSDNFKRQFVKKVALQISELEKANRMKEARLLRNLFKCLDLEAISFDEILKDIAIQRTNILKRMQEEEAQKQLEKKAAQFNAVEEYLKTHTLQEAVAVGMLKI